MEGTRPKPCRIGGHPAPIGASPTQPYKCGQNVKVKVKINLFISALANLFISAKAKTALFLTLTLILKYRPHL